MTADIKIIEADDENILDITSLFHRFFNDATINFNRARQWPNYGFHPWSDYSFMHIVLTSTTMRIVILIDRGVTMAIVFVFPTRFVRNHSERTPLVTS